MVSVTKMFAGRKVLRKAKEKAALATAKAAAMTKARGKERQTFAASVPAFPVPKISSHSNRERRGDLVLTSPSPLRQ